MARRSARKNNSGKGPRCVFYPDAGGYDSDGNLEEKLLCEGQRVMFRSELEFGRAYAAPGDEADVYGVRASDDDVLEAIIFRMDDGTIAKLDDEDVLAELSEHIVEVTRTIPFARGAGASKDLDYINEARRRAHQKPLDPIAAGWTADDIAAEARRLRSSNPRDLRAGDAVRISRSHGHAPYRGVTGVIESLVPVGKAYVLTEQEGRLFVDVSNLESVAKGNPVAKRSKRRKKNPISTAATVAILIGAGAAAVAGGYYAYRRFGRPKALGGGGLEGILQEGAAIGDAPFLITDIALPIQLQVPANPLPVEDEFDRVPFLQLRTMENGEPKFTDVEGGVIVGADSPATVRIVASNGEITILDLADPAIGTVVTDLSPEITRLAYELALHHIHNRGVQWSNPTQRDAAIRDILQKVAPSTDWSNGLAPYVALGDEWTVWSAVDLIGTIANQSYFNKQA
jgi:hypothetical protein